MSEARIIGLGDSLTYGYGVAPGQGWFDRMQEYFPAFYWDNCGVPGDSTSGMLRRLAREVSVKPPAYVSILGGVNDLMSGVPPQTVLEHLMKIRELAEAQDITPWLLLPLTISLHPGRWGWLNPQEAAEVYRRILILRDQIQQRAEEKAWICFDLMSVLPEMAAVEAYFLEDGIHIDAHLHALIALGFKTYIMKQYGLDFFNPHR